MRYLVIGILTILAGTYALTGTSTPANAASCSSIHGTPESRFNPTSLSPYQECILDQFRADETAGTIGNLFWVRNIDGSYTSMQTTLLAQSGSEAAAIEMVTKAVFDKTQASLTAALIELDETQAMLAFTKDKLANKKARIQRLKAKRDRLKAKISTMLDALTAAPVVPSVNSPTDVITNDVKREAKAYSEARNHLHRLNNYIKNGDYENQGHMLDILIGDVVSDAANPWWVEVRAEIQSYIEMETTKAFRAGYEAGYDDGYQDGYADGYADGWNDAMDSVQ